MFNDANVFCPVNHIREKFVNTSKASRVSCEIKESVGGGVNYVTRNPKPGLARLFS